MILLENQTNQAIDLSLMENVVRYLNVTKDIELLIVNNLEIQKLNKEFRGKENATDVLSFPLEDIEHMPLGSIVISIDKAIELSNTLQHPLEHELTLLFTHGLLHLLGYDHETDSGQMRELEEDVIAHFNLPRSLIVRNKGVQ